MYIQQVKSAHKTGEEKHITQKIKRTKKVRIDFSKEKKMRKKEMFTSCAAASPQK